MGFFPSLLFFNSSYVSVFGINAIHLSFHSKKYIFLRWTHNKNIKFKKANLLQYRFWHRNGTHLKLSFDRSLFLLPKPVTAEFSLPLSSLPLSIIVLLLKGLLPPGSSHSREVSPDFRASVETRGQESRGILMERCVLPTWVLESESLYDAAIWDTNLSITGEGCLA